MGWLEDRKLLLGVNYWSRRKSMYMWKEFAPEEIREELTEISSLGLNVLRIFLLWEDFQPQPDKVDVKAILNLKDVMDIAHELNLKVLVTLLQGHMSGVNWMPEWACEEGAHPKYWFFTGGRLRRLTSKNIYSNPEVVGAELRLVRAVVEELREHPALLGWDIANEIDNVLIPESEREFTEWVALISASIKELDRVHPVTIGTHAENLELKKNVNLREIAPYLDFISMHGYPLYSSYASSPLDTEFVPALQVLTQELVAAKPVAFTEFGLPTDPNDRGTWIEVKNRSDLPPYAIYLASHSEAEAYYERVLRGLQRVGSVMILAWCYSDYSEELWSEPPLREIVHERWFGLFNSDGSLKATGEAIRRFAHLQPKRETPLRGIIPADLIRDYYANPSDSLRRALDILSPIITSQEE